MRIAFLQQSTGAILFIWYYRLIARASRTGAIYVRKPFQACIQLVKKILEISKHRNRHTNVHTSFIYFRKPECSPTDMSRDRLSRGVKINAA